MGQLFDRPPKELAPFGATFPFTFLTAPSTSPAPEDKALLNTSASLLHSLETLLTSLEEYSPCMEPIKLALSSPLDASLQQAAFTALLPNVKVIQTFYERSKEVSEFLPVLVGELSAPTALSSRPHLTYAFLTVLSKIHAIDSKKMMCPGLQNDFSFYRRSVGKFASQATVSETSAGQISMWIAEASPLTSSLVPPLKKALSSNALLGPALGRVSTLCAWLLSKNPSLPPPVVLLLASSMTEALVLLDRCSARGAFHAASGLQVRKVIAALAALGGENAGTRDLCKNGIKFSTVHYKDASTPAFVEEMLQ